MTAVIMWVGAMIGGRGGMMFALVLAGAMNFFSYWYSDKIVLRMYQAQEVTAQQAPELQHRKQADNRSNGNDNDHPVAGRLRVTQQARIDFACGIGQLQIHEKGKAVGHQGDNDKDGKDEQEALA